ncbi:MAG: CCA tRNA nucleotidyltransferase [Clostridia bacterium]|nr:CCA tRNA nucleotidyltransferase [Clostridia bacterium]
MTDKLIIPNFALTALSVLGSNGYKAYLVGGCVRDVLMGRIPGDYDITTSAAPDETLACFKDFKTVETGIKHGTVTVIIEGNPLEITTFRIDGDYSDNRRPDSVSFSSSVADDLARRDFTVNAIAYNPDEGYVDLYGGKEDIKNQIIRCVGEADKRFNEDSLRILRAMRFAASLDFKIEEKTLSAAHKNACLLENISVERIYTEFIKTVCAKSPGKILYEFKKEIEVFIPEFTNLEDEMLRSVFYSVDRAEADRFVRLAVLFACFDSETVRKIFERLKTDKLTEKTVCQILNCRKFTGSDRITARWILNALSYENALRFCEAQSALDPKNTEQILELKFNIEKAYLSNECVNVGQLAVGGNDILNNNIASGVKIGKILNELLELVITGQAENKFDSLLEAAKKLK